MSVLAKNDGEIELEEEEIEDHFPRMPSTGSEDDDEFEDEIETPTMALPLPASASPGHRVSVAFAGTSGATPLSRKWQMHNRNRSMGSGGTASRSRGLSGIGIVLGDLENTTLGYGQEAVFHSELELYFNCSNQTKRIVFYNVNIHRITKINNVKETFRIALSISMSWLPTLSEWNSYQKHKKADTLSVFKPDWVPILDFSNKVRTFNMDFDERVQTGGHFAITKLPGRGKLGYDQQLCEFIRCKLNCDLELSSPFYLRNFPFDVQDLVVELRSLSNATLIPESRTRNFISASSTSSATVEEWAFCNILVESSTVSFSKVQILKIRLKVRRRSEIYLARVCFFLCLISGLSLVSFSIPSDSLGERMGVLVTLVLTSVMYNDIMSQTTPKVPYLTLLDKYIIASFLFMICVAVSTACVSFFDPFERYNRWLFVASLALFISYHCFFVIYSYRMYRFEERKVYLPSEGIEALMKRQTTHCSDRIEVPSSNRTESNRGTVFSAVDTETMEAAMEMVKALTMNTSLSVAKGLTIKKQDTALTAFG